MGAEAGLQVLMTTDTIGGVWQQTIELSAGLCARGCRVALAAMGGVASDAQRAQVARVDGMSLHARPWRLEWMDEPWADLEAAGVWLLDLADGLQPDLVHLNQFAFGALAFDAPKLVVGHSSVTSWWRAVKGEAAPDRWDRYRALVQRGLAGADLVAAPTDAMLLSLQRDFGFEGSGVVLPNGRRPQDYPALEKQPLIVAAGRLWDEAKNLAALERIAPALPWPVVVAGQPRAPQAASACEARHVRLLGELAPHDLAQWLGRASICAHPAYYEPFGLSVLEAALASCALVLGDVPSLHEVWGPAALYAPPADDVAIAQALQRLIGDEPLRRRMGALAHERALRFSSDVMVDGYLSAYRSLVHRNIGAAACAS